MRKWIGTAGALLLLFPQALIAQHHEHGGGGGGGHPGGGGGGGFHGGPPGGGEHRGGPPGGGEHRGGPPGGFENRGGGRPGGWDRGPGGWNRGPGGSHARPNVVIDNRTVIRNDFHGVPGRGDIGRGHPGPGARGLPPPPRGNWHRGWYGGQVSGFRPFRAPPFRYPRGYSYRRWGIGLILPSLLFAPTYYYGGWATFGAYPPPPGDRWIRYGPDLLLVNIATGRIDDAIYGAFY